MRRKRICGLSVIPMCAGKWEKSTPTWHEPCRKQVSSECVILAKVVNYIKVGEIWQKVKKQKYIKR